MPNNVPDQTDVVAQLETAKTEHAALKAQFDTLTATHAALVTERDTLTASLATATSGVKNLTAVVEARTQERDTLQAKVATLEASQADFNKAVAEKVAQAGIAGKATGSGQAGKPENLTWTEKALAAKSGAASN
jgi:chromosome segregation ATPase